LFASDKRCGDHGKCRPADSHATIEDNGGGLNILNLERVENTDISIQVIVLDKAFWSNRNASGYSPSVPLGSGAIDTPMIL
jgi:hypothetical protein